MLFLFIAYVLLLTYEQIDLKFINRYRDTWPPAIACISGGILDLKRLVTHTVSLEKSSDALNIASDTRNGSIKVLVVDDEDVRL